MASELRIGGFVPFSATDYPGLLSAVVFCQGCPWRCGYCHNPHLLPARSESPVAWSAIVAFLETRRGLLDGVVFSGGEPTAQPGLANAMRTAKRLGFRIGLHTAGIYPKRLAEALALVDWVGLDIKAPFADYERVTAVPESGARALESARMLLASGVPHELRTTVDETLLDETNLAQLDDELAHLGARRHVRQVCRR